MSKGTPKTLGEAIENGLCELDSRDSTEESILMFKAQIKDFLAQKFTVAFAHATTENEVQHLKNLWNQIIS